MAWYEAFIPAIGIALLVRWEAMFFLPYWSWLQLIPEVGILPNRAKRNRKKTEALLRRLAISLVTGLILGLFWPNVYGVWEVAIVGALAGGLLLWPLVFNPGLEYVNHPRWLVVLLYALVPISHASSASLGYWLAELIHRRGGLMALLRDELPLIILNIIVVLFVTALSRKTSDRLEEQYEQDVRG